ncbi:MAG: phage major capsid protein [Bacteroidales bacterium]|nr:phage major capsid protein [Candidatus Latescibacterota bacterium]
MIKKKSPTSADALIGLTKREIQDFCVIRMINAQLSGDWSRAGLEREASEAVADLLGRIPVGSYVPYDVLVHDQREVSSATSPGLIGTDQQPDSMIQVMRNASITARLGATLYPGLVGDAGIPRQEDASNAAWIDNETYSGTDKSSPTYSALNLSPKTLRVRIDISRKMLKQSQPMIEGLLRDEISGAIGGGIDAAAIYGSGVAPIPQGIVGASGTNSVEIDTNGGSLDWSHLVLMESKLGNHQQLPGQAYVCNTGTLGALKTTPRDTVGNVGGFLMADDGTVNGHPCLVSNTLPNDGTKGTGTDLSTMVFGAWSSLIVALWGGLDLEADKVTLGERGGIVLRAFQDIDLGLRYPGAFTVVEDIVT